ncbi:uncharacterized protein DUF3455 [Acidipila rosea]|uniref:Uncharacterized protein DUF3455 n=2 Tax=Acidipila rosea TaxID=768535 RepID=A0A4R1L631_9BACT|nr:uncharacterized protein DUF3455 [Acidipila rosea]
MSGMRVWCLLLLILAPSAMLRGQTDKAGASGLVLQAKGDGVQIYECGKEHGFLQWQLEGPDAKLLDGNGKVVGKHFAGPTWQLNDGSHVKGRVISSQASPDAGSIPWLLLSAVPGTASGKLAQVAYIRRSNTHGGLAPKAGCEKADQAGQKIKVPYTADYSFYTR